VTATTIAATVTVLATVPVALMTANAMARMIGKDAMMTVSAVRMTVKMTVRMPPTAKTGKVIHSRSGPFSPY
jgi:hypothetical protein